MSMKSFNINASTIYLCFGTVFVYFYELIEKENTKNAYLNIIFDCGFQYRRFQLQLKALAAYVNAPPY